MKHNLAALLCLAGAIPFSQTYSQRTSGDAVDLDEVQLRGDEDQSSDFFLEPSFNSKLLASWDQLPRSLEIVTAEQFEEFGATNLQETLNYTTGVFSGPFGLDTRVDSFRIRGITPEQYQDGFKANYGFYNQARTEIYAVESVEVIKGPASALYGQGALGGIINTNLKRPKSVVSREIDIQVGSHDRYQLGIDLTGPANEDASLFYRLVAMTRESDTEVDYVSDDAVMVMPSITWQPGERTRFTFLAKYQENDTGSTLQFIPDIDGAPGSYQ
ncbi:MAG: TonB-dependent receptor plug domain-containing protein, partial [Verrucomicrobiota bacterium]